jgi:hypothetical protein
MQNNKCFKEELIKKIQQCLSETGFKADVSTSEHEAVIAARMEVEGKTLRVVAHISDREVKPSNCGAVNPELARSRLLNTVVRPTLAVQAAAGTISEEKC